jgi:hypothetical protein
VEIEEIHGATPAGLPPASVCFFPDLLLHPQEIYDFLRNVVMYPNYTAIQYTKVFTVTAGRTSHLVLVLPSDRPPLTASVTARLALCAVCSGISLSLSLLYPLSHLLTIQSKRVKADRQTDRQTRNTSVGYCLGCRLPAQHYTELL